jgi:hypothetical protein
MFIRTPLVTQELDSKKRSEYVLFCNGECLLMPEKLSGDPHERQAEILQKFWDTLVATDGIDACKVEPNRTSKRNTYLARTSFWRTVVRAAQASDMSSVSYQFGDPRAVLRTSFDEQDKPPMYAFITDRYAQNTLDMPRYRNLPPPEAEGISLGAGMSITQFAVTEDAALEQRLLSGTFCGTGLDFYQDQACLNLIVGGDENALILAQLTRTDIRKNVHVEIAAPEVTSAMYNARYTF